VIDFVILAAVVAAGAIVGIVVGRVLAPRIGRLPGIGDDEPDETRDG
jgi:hypothetical protein